MKMQGRDGRNLAVSRRGSAFRKLAGKIGAGMGRAWWTRERALEAKPEPGAALFK